MAANRIYYSVLPIIKCRDVHRLTKIRIYKTMIRTVLSYGCETWMLTKTSEKMINTFERKILRRILGPVLGQDGWRIRYNKELYEVFDDPEVFIWVKLGKLRWTGHVQRMPEHRIPRRTLEGRIEDRRPIGKPRKR